jgi:hypothetical protein
MRQENRFVAQLFHFLAPFVDYERDLLICVDGGAATHHAARPESAIVDPDIPDIWCAFLGKPGFTGIEAKMLNGNTISVRKGQLSAWRSSGNGYYRPSFWVAADVGFTVFHCWQHSTMASRLDTTASTVQNVSLSMTKHPPDFSSKKLAELALYLLSHA